MAAKCTVLLDGERGADWCDSQLAYSSRSDRYSKLAPFSSGSNGLPGSHAGASCICTDKKIFMFHEFNNVDSESCDLRRLIHEQRHEHLRNWWHVREEHGRGHTSKRLQGVSQHR